MDFPLIYKIPKRHAFYYLVVFLSACLLMANKGGFVALMLLIVLSVPLLFNPAAIVPLLFLTSWHNVFALRPVVYVHLFYSLLFYFSFLLPCNQKHYQWVWGFPVFAFVAILLMVWVLLTGWHSVSGNMVPSFVMFFELALLVLMTKVRLFDAEFSRRCILLIAAMATVCFTLIALFHPFQVELNGSELSMMARPIIRLSVLPQINPNITSRIIIVNFVILIAEAFRSRRMGMTLFALLNVVPIMLCGSRTSLFSMFVVVIIAILSSHRINWKTMALVGTFLLLFGILYTFGAGLNGSKEMTLSSVVEDAGSGRLYTIVGLFDSVIPNHLLMGIGVGRDNYTQLGFGYDADNMYVDVLTQMGLVGFFLLFFMYFVFMCDYLSRRVFYCDKLLARLVLLVFLLLGVGYTVFEGLGFWFALTLLVFFRNSSPVLEERRWRVSCRKWRLQVERRRKIDFALQNSMGL